MPKKKTEDAAAGEEIMEPIMLEGAENNHEQEETPGGADTQAVPDAAAETGTVADEDAGMDPTPADLPADGAAIAEDEEVTVPDSVAAMFGYGAAETSEALLESEEPPSEKNAKKKAPKPEPVKIRPEPAPSDVPDSEPVPAKKNVPARKKTIFDLDLRELDRNLSVPERQEWSAIYASFRSRSIMTGTVIGADETTFDVLNRDTNEFEKVTLHSLVILNYRVKILIPETEVWMPGEERPPHVLRNMVGSQIDYVILEVDREGGCAVASRRMALAARRYYFSNPRIEHKAGDMLKCRVIVVGAKRCIVECGGYNFNLEQRDLSYTMIPDLRAKYHPGQELDCVLKEYDKEAGRLFVSVKETTPNPFVDADLRHPVGSRRQAVISGKYAGGVFCNLPDDTVCLCLYSAQHSDANFAIGDSVIIVIRQYDYGRQFIFGRILAKW